MGIRSPCRVIQHGDSGSDDPVSGVFSPRWTPLHLLRAWCPHSKCLRVDALCRPFTDHPLTSSLLVSPELFLPSPLYWGGD